MSYKKNLIFFLIILLSAQTSVAKPNILVTITPIASLVAMLTKDKANIIILDSASGCPHHHNAKPSDRALIDNANMVIYIDSDFDSLASSMLTEYKGVKVKISDFSTIDFKAIKNNVNWHFWLDLKNVQSLQYELAKIIGQTFPDIKNEVEQNLAEANRIIQELEKTKKSELGKLEQIILLSNSLEHFFKSITKNDNELLVFQTSNISLKTMQKLTNALRADSLKCIIMDSEQNADLYKKYNKNIVQLDSENWQIDAQNEQLQSLFITKYKEMIKRLKACGVGVP